MTQLYDKDGNPVENTVSAEEAQKQLDAKQAELEADAKKQKELDDIKKQNQKEIEKMHKEKVETVTVNKKSLEEMMHRLERLEYAADASRIGKFDDKNRKELPKVVLLTKYNGKAVMAWKMLKDEVQKINGSWRESQIIQIILEDDSTIDLPYLQFIQEVVKEDATIMSRTKDNDGHETLKIRTNKDGKEYSIDIRFIN